MNFLSARWQHLLMANYSVSSEALAEFVPERTGLDEFDGHTFVSLVAFMFDDTRLLGIPAPLHRCFEEVNLRFYVSPEHDRSIRAVTFVKELVPRALIPLIANSMFDENYEAVPMGHEIAAGSFMYCWGENLTNRFSAQIDSSPNYPAGGSISEFITEHYWGFTQGRNRTIEYQVKHPQWRCCEVSEYNIDVDFQQTYGSKFAFLNDLKPYNVLYAEGSEVSVSFPRRLA